MGVCHHVLFETRTFLKFKNLYLAVVAAKKFKIKVLQCFLACEGRSSGPHLAEDWWISELKAAQILVYEATKIFLSFMREKLSWPNLCLEAPFFNSIMLVISEVWGKRSNNIAQILCFFFSGPLPLKSHAKIFFLELYLIVLTGNAFWYNFILLPYLGNARRSETIAWKTFHLL